MPATSKAQFRYMARVCHGEHRKGDPPKSTACEYLHGSKGKSAYRRLPERVAKKEK